MLQNKRGKYTGSNFKMGIQANMLRNFEKKVAKVTQPQSKYI